MANTEIAHHKQSAMDATQSLHVGKGLNRQIPMPRIKGFTAETRNTVSKAH